VEDDLRLRAATLTTSEEMLSSSVRTSVPIQPWPLPSSPTALVFVAGEGSVLPDAGQDIVASSDRAALRALRRPPPAVQLPPILVRSGTDLFRLLLRDEPPAAVLAALAALFQP
jgi:hypothetical protein